MSSESANILLAITLLWTKHTLADYFLQNTWQVLYKHRYCHPGGLLHAFIHVALTPVVFLVLPLPALEVVGYILLGEFVVHYHLDWFKARVVRSKSWSAADPAYWRAFGLDQFAHFATYIVIVGVLKML